MQVDNRFCIYLEYVHPGSISNYVREHFGAVTESVVRNFTRHIVSGLAYLHNTKTIHRWELCNHFFVFICKMRLNLANKWEELLILNSNNSESISIFCFSVSPCWKEILMWWLVLEICTDFMCWWFVLSICF